jgi:hypothetical protein
VQEDEECSICGLLRLIPRPNEQSQPNHKKRWNRSLEPTRECAGEIGYYNKQVLLSKLRLSAQSGCLTCDALASGISGAFPLEDFSSYMVLHFSLYGTFRKLRVQFLWADSQRHELELFKVSGMRWRLCHLYSC